MEPAANDGDGVLRPWERPTAVRRLKALARRYLRFDVRFSIVHAASLLAAVAACCLAHEAARRPGGLAFLPEALRGPAGVMAISFGTVLVAQVVATVLFRRTLQPLVAFEVSSRRIAAGETWLGLPGVDFRRPDLVGRLARSFRDMAQAVEAEREAAAAAGEQMAQTARELEARVAERTAQFESANTRLSGEIAEKEDFLRAVSHDLNAPLRNIAGMVAMIQKKHAGQVDEDLARRLERIQKNVEHETDLINELLELSRIKTQRTSFEDLEIVDLEAMVWDLRGLFENDLRERQIELHLEASLPKLRAEKARVRQVFQNLIDNAIKYMDEGSENPSGVREKGIYVGCRVAADEAQFWVRDTGQGIAAEDVEKVFYVFRRGKNHGAAAGKGVGLASVKSIVETYNGTIWVESEVGRGSAFRFTLNARHVVADALSAAPARAAA